MYSQQDPNYSFVHLGETKETILTSGCQLCNMAWALNVQHFPWDPPKLNRYLAQEAGYASDGRIVYSALGPLGLRCVRAVACQDVLADEKDLVHLIGQAYVVVIKVSFRPWLKFSPHWLLAAGLVSDDIECLDPWQLPGAVPYVGVLTHYARPSWTLGNAVYGYAAFDYDGRDVEKLPF